MNEFYFYRQKKKQQKNELKNKHFYRFKANIVVHYDHFANITEIQKR